MICYVVLDTNVLVSALLSSKDDSATVQVLGKVLGGEIIPVYSNAITKEYREVLSRKKFGFAGGTIDYFHYKCFNITDVVSPIKKFADGFMRQNFGLYFSCIVAQIPVSFTDRLITTFAGFGVYRLMQRTLGREEK